MRRHTVDSKRIFYTENPVQIATFLPTHSRKKAKAKHCANLGLL